MRNRQKGIFFYKKSLRIKRTHSFFLGKSGANLQDTFGTKFFRDSIFLRIAGSKKKKEYDRQKFTPRVYHPREEYGVVEKDGIRIFAQQKEQNPCV